jgi:endoglucanase
MNRNTVQFSRFSCFSLSALAGALVLVLSSVANAQSAYVRVSQVGYETGNGPFQAYLMSTVPSTPTWTFSVISATNFPGKTVYGPSPVGTPIGTGKWINSKLGITYYVYPLSFTVPGGDTYYILVNNPVAAQSPYFAVNTPNNLYPGLLLNTLWFYETDEDGPDYVPNALRCPTLPCPPGGHLHDESAFVYAIPQLNSTPNELITTTGTPLTLTGSGFDGAGGWWDAGDYMKYVETTSYTVALMEIGIRDFPNQMGMGAGVTYGAPPPAPAAGTYASYSGTASWGGATQSSDFDGSAQFGINWLMEMWDDNTKTLYFQVDNSQDWAHFSNLETEYDIWIQPQDADDYGDCPAESAGWKSSDYFYICYRPAFPAGAANSKISPNLAGRMAAAFAEYYQLYGGGGSSNPTANAALLYAQDIFTLADTSLADPAGGTWAENADNGTCPAKDDCLLTSIPFNGYPETVWDDDMELGATELYIALQSANGNLPPGLPVTTPMTYLTAAAQSASNYITKIFNDDKGNGPYADTLNLYDVSGLAHFELYRAIGLANASGEDTSGLAVNQSTLLTQLEAQMGVAITQAGSDPFGFGFPWGNESRVSNLGSGDVTSHGAGLSVMASELSYLCSQSGVTCTIPASSYNTYSQQWLANILGANSWGVSFIVGDGTTFPNCIQHQVANLVGALNGTSRGTPILWGAAVEGPVGPGNENYGALSTMNGCPAEGWDPQKGQYGVDTFAIFNGNGAKYRDSVAFYSTNEPGIDLTATSFLMWSWRLAGSPNSLP